MKKLILISLVVVLTVSLVVSIIFIWDYYSKSNEQKAVYDELVSIVERTDTTEEISTTVSEQGTDDKQHTENNKVFSVNYTELNTLNSDTVGWIKVDGTPINYPVVQSKDKPNFYIDHNFYKQGSVYGCPFIQENCDVNEPSDNVVIYGHNMNDGSMFAGLNKYTSHNFYKAHRYIEFDTLYEKHRYEIVSVFKTSAQSGFRYYGFVNALSSDDFNFYISTCKELSLYDTGVSAIYGDKLITLSTCEYTHTNGRLVVVAKRV